ISLQPDNMTFRLQRAEFFLGGLMYNQALYEYIELSKIGNRETKFKAYKAMAEIYKMKADLRAALQAINEARSLKYKTDVPDLDKLQREITEEAKSAGITLNVRHRDSQKRNSN